MKLREIYLITETETLNPYGVPTVSETKSNALFVEIRSVSGSEVFKGRQANVAPSFYFVISSFDYNGEEIVEYDGKRYAVYRTYEPDDDTIEVYCQIEGGVSYVEPE